MTWLGNVMRQMLTIKTLSLLANIVFTAFLTIQLARVFEDYIKPQTTRTWDEYARLEDMEFPLVVKICVIPGFNQTAVREQGYYDTFSYFVGRDHYANDTSTYGWAGHTNDSGTVNEALAKVEGYQLENIIKEVYVWDKDAVGIVIPLKYLKVSKVNYPNNCRSLDLSEVPELNETSYNQLFITIHELGNHTVTVHFNGRSLDTGRNIREHNLHSTGDDIVLGEENVHGRSHSKAIC